MRILAALIVFLPMSAAAQTYVNPVGNGAYIIQRPGGPTTYVNPTGNGSFIATTPSTGNVTYGNPTGNGSYVITSPSSHPCFSYDCK